ncbi:unnamed protein product [Effrenium voratum]|nr:unnamed protein product [Effrenium voratum]
MATATPELEEKLLRRRQKVEQNYVPQPKKGSKAWSAEMAKTVSQQRRAYKSEASEGNGNPQDVEGVGLSPRNTDSSAPGRPSRGLTAGLSILTLSVLALLLGLYLPLRSEAPTSARIAGQLREEVQKRPKPEEARPEPEVQKRPEPEEVSEPDFVFDPSLFGGMVKTSAIQSLHPSVAVDTKVLRDLTNDWGNFLEENPSFQQVYRLGRLTVTQGASRPLFISVNITLTNTGPSAWPARSCLQLAHGLDLGAPNADLGKVTEPGADRKISMHLRIPAQEQADSPTCIWALSVDGNVFGVLLILELDWIDSSGYGLLTEALDGLQTARAQVHSVELVLQDEALQHDPARAGDVTEEWADDLSKTGVTQAYRLGSLIVAPLSVPAKLAVSFTLQNLGQDAWPEGTSLRLLSGNALGLESLDIDQDSPVSYFAVDEMRGFQGVERKGGTP